MKKKLFLAASVLFGTTVFAQVGINTTAPNAQLDIRATSATAPSNTDGLLIPKIDVFPATNPTAAQQGMLLYLTTTSGTNMPGFYYWDNPTTTWVSLKGSSAGWQLAGNNVTAADFMGSVNDADVIFKRNNIRAGRLGTYNTSFGNNSLNSASSAISCTAIGSFSLEKNLNGYWNTGIGAFTLNNNTSGEANVASGISSMLYNTSGSYNTASGRLSLGYNTTGNFNTASGNYALLNNTTGSNNTGLGYNTQTGTNLTNATAIGATASATTSNSLVLGSISGTNGATASAKVGIGTTAPNAALEVKAVNPATPTNTEGLLIPRINVFPATNPTAAQHGMQVFLTTAVGTQQPGFYYWDNPTTSWVGIGGSTTGNNWALAGNTVNAATNFMGSTNDADVIFKRNNVRAGLLGTTNTSFGLDALSSLTTGVNNVSYGRETLLLNSTGIANSAFGNYSLWKNIDGSHNVAYGGGALQDHATGDYNTAIGRGALIFSTSGNNNTAVGYYAYSNNYGFSNSTALGANTVISASNQVRLGNNAVSSIGGQVDWTTLSDARFKTENAAKVPGIDFIKKLRPVTYYVNHEAMNTYLNVGKENGDQNNGDKAPSSGSNAYKPTYTKTLETGFMAQEVEQAAKELGYEFNGVDAPKNDKDYYGLRYGQFVVPLVKAVQELNEKLEQKQAENDQLKAMLLELEKRIAKLEKNASN